MVQNSHTIILEEEFFDAIENEYFNDLVDEFMYLLHPESVSVVYNVHLTDVAKINPNFELLSPMFGGAPIDTIQHTFILTGNHWMLMFMV
jgi:hypothetical protein